MRELNSAQIMSRG